MRLLILIVAWSMIEIGLFVTVGAWMGLLATWAVVLITAVAGVLLIRWQKRTAVSQVIRDLRRLSDPLTPAAHSALIVLAGVLLILPGFLTDVLGLILLLPPVRQLIIDRFKDHARTRARMAAMDAAVAAMLHPRRHPKADDIVDAEEVDPPGEPHKPSGWTKP